MRRAHAEGRTRVVSTTTGQPELDTFPKLYARNAAQRPERPAIRRKDRGIWQTWNWAQSWQIVRALAHAFAGLGVGRGDKITTIGDVTLVADRILLGDVSAFGDIFVQSPDITILTRSGGNILGPASIATDQGADAGTDHDLGEDVVLFQRLQGAVKEVREHRHHADRTRGLRRSKASPRLSGRRQC